jgi:hypothetical protein
MLPYFYEKVPRTDVFGVNYGNILSESGCPGFKDLQDEIKNQKISGIAKHDWTILFTINYPFINFPN